MKIGKNLHIENRKKAYRKPVLEVVEIDRDVIIMNPTTGEPFPATAPSVSGIEQNQPTYDESQQYPKDNPFGGGTPTYER